MAATLRTGRDFAARAVYAAIKLMPEDRPGTTADRRLNGWNSAGTSGGAYIADFCCVEAMLIVEVDGASALPEDECVQIAR